MLVLGIDKKEEEGRKYVTEAGKVSKLYYTFTTLDCLTTVSWRQHLCKNLRYSVPFNCDLKVRNKLLSGGDIFHEEYFFFIYSE